MQSLIQIVENGTVNRLGHYQLNDQAPDHYMMPQIHLHESNFKRDVYYLHKTALTPLLPGAGEQALINSCKQIEHIGESRFFAFLKNQGIAPMWHQAFRSLKGPPLVSGDFVASLHKSRVQETANYLLQNRALKEIWIILGDKNIGHAVIKGCHIREIIYPEPSVRPACDIDVLVSPDDQVNAMDKERFFQQTPQ